jgi:glycosyltransferase involved in cell wall biosynthesis
VTLQDKVPLPRVIILISGLDIGGAHGGAERFGLELCRNLPRDEFDTRLIAFWRRDTGAERYWQEQLDESEVPVLFAAKWSGRFTFRDYRAGVETITHKLDSSGPVEILHSHYQMGTLAAILLKSRGQTSLAMRTAHVSREWGTGFPSWVMRQVFTNWLYPLLLDKEVGVSQAIVDALQHHPGNRLSQKKPLLIHNALYPDIFKPAEAGEIPGLPSDQPSQLLLGSIGRMTNQKGYRYLLEAMPLVLERFPQVQLILIGDGELRLELEMEANQLGLNQKVSFLGQKENVVPYLSELDLFVLPSIYEGLPTVILESMACGVPVVATNIPGTRELIQDGQNGWLVEPKNPLALAQTLINALSSQQKRSQMADRARLTVEGFRIEKIAKQYAALYRELMQRNPTT